MASACEEKADCGSAWAGAAEESEERGEGPEADSPRSSRRATEGAWMGEEGEERESDEMSAPSASQFGRVKDVETGDVAVWATMSTGNVRHDAGRVNGFCLVL